MLIVDSNSELTPVTAQRLIGKTIRSVEAHEYSLTLTFTDGTELFVHGSNWDGCALEVDVA